MHIDACICTCMYVCSSSKNVAQRSDQQKSDETIELVKEAQAESSKMRYIDPAKTETPPIPAKRSVTVSILLTVHHSHSIKQFVHCLKFLAEE